MHNCIIIKKKKYFSDDHFAYNYSQCHYLEGIKDAHCECSRLVRAVEQCAKTYGGHGNRDALEL